MFDCNIYTGSDAGGDGHRDLDDPEWTGLNHQYKFTGDDSDGSDGRERGSTRTDGIAVDGEQRKLCVDYIDDTIKKLFNADGIGGGCGSGELQQRNIHTGGECTGKRSGTVDDHRSTERDSDHHTGLQRERGDGPDGGQQCDAAMDDQ